jgi:hypothetical protein
MGRRGFDTGSSGGGGMGRVGEFVDAYRHGRGEVGTGKREGCTCVAGAAQRGLGLEPMRAEEVGGRAEGRGAAAESSKAGGSFLTQILSCLKI